MRFTIKIFLSTLLLLLAFNSNALQHDNSSTTLDEDSKITTIPAHSRSATVNAKHEAECREMGGVDVTDDSVVTVGSITADVSVCRLKNNNYHSNLINTSGISAQSEAATGFYSESTYTAISKAIFNVANPNPAAYHLAMGMAIFETGGSSSQCGRPNYCGACIDFMGIVPSGTYTLSMSCKTVAGGRVPSLAYSEIHYFNGKNENISSDSQYIIHPDNDTMVSPKKNLGISQDTPGCNIPSSFIGNPINTATGNKFQQEEDIKDSGSYPLNFVRYYNSDDPSYTAAYPYPVWKHNYSTKLLDLDTPMITMVLSDGRETRFYDESGVIKSSPTELGTLRKTLSGYEYTSVWNEISDFDSTSRLIRTVNPFGLVHNISYNGNVVTVTDNFNHSLTITNNDKGQPINVKNSDDKIVNYNYDIQNRLVKVTRNGKSRIYHYEDSRFPYALTGITDENGIRYVSWTYDAKGRANSSSYIGDNNKVQITYNSDTQTTVTNPLNRTSIYTYKIIDGVKRITKIQGNATSNCPVIGSTYEYNDHGLLTLKTDGRGIKTKYQYNDLGEETSRTEGFGTPEAKTTTTTWDSTLHRPITVTNLDRVIHYSYDSHGRMTNKTIQTLN